MPKKKQPAKPRKPAAPSTPPIAFDRRAMEKSMNDLTRLLSTREFESIDEMNAFLQQTIKAGVPIEAPPSTPLEQAQDLMYEAWSTSGRRRVQLAREALALSPDCADAYVLLAEETARKPQEARDLYQKGVEAGERAIGAETFEESVGHFWGIVETRPYMRAREGLASVLWHMGEHQAAIEHLTEMLRLNPGDNQGLRYTLMQWLVETGANEQVSQLLEQYPDDGAAAWVYTQALWRFQQEGASDAANDALNDALTMNRFVPAYLLGQKRLPQRLPEYVGMGDDNEAIAYAVDGLSAWHTIPGAVDWLASRTKGAKT